MRPFFKSPKYEKMKPEERYIYAFALFDTRLTIENCIAVCKGLHTRTIYYGDYKPTDTLTERIKKYYTKDLTLDVSEISYGRTAHFVATPIFPPRGNPYIEATLNVDGKIYRGDKVEAKLRKYRENLIDYQADMHLLGDCHREENRSNYMSY